MERNNVVMDMAQAALMAALCYIGFQYLRIDIPIGGDKTAIHFGNTFCVLGALLLGGVYGGMAGAVGMTLADLTSGYANVAPKTFLLKLCIGLIVGFVAHKICKINEKKSKSQIMRYSAIAAIAGMGFNVIFDPLIGYFYKVYLLQVPDTVANIFVKWTAATTFVNAITAVVMATLLYNALRPILTKSGLLAYHRKEAKIAK